MKGGHAFEIEVRMDNLRGGDWGEKQNKLMCLISPTQKFKLEKITLNTEE